MTDRFKEAYDTLPENYEHPDILEWFDKYMGTISKALTLAAEHERVKKERDEFERRLNDRSEWFFRWIARGKAGYAGMNMEQCADMIWHHPDNPYAENNPWDKTTKKVNENG